MRNALIGDGGLELEKFRNVHVCSSRTRDLTAGRFLLNDSEEMFGQLVGEGAGCRDS